MCSLVPPASGWGGRLSDDSRPRCASAHRPELVLPDGLEVVPCHVLGDVPAEDDRLHVGGAVVEAGPDAGLDDLVERLREPVEVARRLTREAAARHVEADL